MMIRSRHAAAGCLLTVMFVVAAGACGATKDRAQGVDVKIATTGGSTSDPRSTATVEVPQPQIDFKDPNNFAGVAWTDDIVIQALAADSRWDPGGCFEKLTEGAAKSVDMLDAPEECKPLYPLACSHVPSQSCVPDECSQTDYSCVPECNRGCSGCAETCATQCDDCKSRCKDDACKLECAKTCGSCRESCVKKLDHCSSAGCAEVAEQCFDTRLAEWKAGTCDKVCPKVDACVEKCPQPEGDFSFYAKYTSDCANKCFSKLGKGCGARFDLICKGMPDASVNFNVHRANKEAEDEMKKIDAQLKKTEEEIKKREAKP